MRAHMSLISALISIQLSMELALRGACRGGSAQQSWCGETVGRFYKKDCRAEWLGLSCATMGFWSALRPSLASFHCLVIAHHDEGHVPGQVPVPFLCTRVE